MAFTEFHYYSETLEIDVSVNVILPETRIMAQQEGKPLPTLYLLHGLSDDHTHWVRQTRLEFYFTFVSEELPRVMEMYFPLSSRREDRFAAGLSMGGYGATKLGLRLPERYAAIASLSGALEMENDYHMRKMRDSDRLYQELLNIFGTEEEFLASDNCLTRLAEQLDPAKAPRMYVACGTADFLFGSNEDFIRRFGEKFSIHYTTEEGAAHTWDFWDRQIEKVLAWLNVPEAE